MTHPKDAKRRKAAKPDALAVVNGAVSVAVPTNAIEVSKMQVEAEADAEEIRALVVDDDESYKFADQVLTMFAQRKDAADAMCKSATGPLYKSARTVEGWFKPLRLALDLGIGHVKAQMGAYRLALWQAEREAREAAAVAAESGDSGAVVEALAVADDMAAKPDGRASVGFSWRVSRIVEDMLPDEWWTPDRKRLDELAAADKSEDGPVVPGVVFERVANIGAKR